MFCMQIRSIELNSVNHDKIHNGMVTYNKYITSGISTTISW